MYCSFESKKSAILAKKIYELETFVQQAFSNQNTINFKILELNNIEVD